MWRSIKRWLKVTGLTLAAVLPVLGVCVWWQWEGVSGMAQGMIQNYKEHALEGAMDRRVAHLPAVDTVKVLRLSDGDESPGQPQFGKDYYGGTLHLIKTEVLSGGAAQDLVTLWRKQRVFPNGVNCHEPHHGLIFLSQGREVGRAVICFHCMNASIPASFLGDGLMGFDSSSPEYAELKRTIEDLVGSAE